MNVIDLDDCFVDSSHLPYSFIFLNDDSINPNYFISYFRYI